MGATASARREPEFDTAAFRRTVTGVLMSSRVLPVQPLIEIVIQYSFSSTVSTLMGPTKSIDSPLQFPTHVRVHTDTKSGVTAYLISDQLTHTFHAVTIPISPLSATAAADRTAAAALVVPVRRLAGKVSEVGFVSRAAHESLFQMPTSMCVDPTDCNRIFLCDCGSIRVLDPTAGGSGGGGVVTVFAGGEITDGYADGTGTNARFHSIADMVCSSDGGTLYVADSISNRIRAVNTKTASVTTIAGDGRGLCRAAKPALAASVQYPRALAFDRHSATPSDSVLYISCAGVVMRFDIQSGEIRAIKHSSHLRPFGIAALPNGWLVVSCVRHNSLYLIDPSTGATELLAGSGQSKAVSKRGGGSGGGTADGAALNCAKFNDPLGLCIDDAQQCAVVADSQNRSLRHVTLPPHLFSTEH